MDRYEGKHKRYLFENVVLFLSETVRNCEDIKEYIFNSMEEGLEVFYETADGCNVNNTLVFTDDAAFAEKAKEAGFAVVGYMKNVARFVVCDLSQVDEYYLNDLFLRARGLPVTICETKRTIIREMTLDDLHEMYKLYALPNVSRWVEPLYDFDEELEFSKAYINNMYGFYGYGLWLVFDKENGELIGRAGLSNREINGENRVELGYVIHDKKIRQGYGFEVCSAIMDYAAEILNLKSLFVCAKNQNTASIALATKLGFKMWGTTDELVIYSKELK